MIPVKLRRVILADWENVLSVRAISKKRLVSKSAVYSLLRRQEENKGTEPMRLGRPPKITPEQTEALERTVLARPDITLEELRVGLELPIRKTEIGNTLHRLGYRMEKRWSKAGDKN